MREKDAIVGAQEKNPLQGRKGERESNTETSKHAVHRDLKMRETKDKCELVGMTVQYFEKYITNSHCSCVARSSELDAL